jgi:hypothetical protein
MVASLDSILPDETARCHREGAQDFHNGQELSLSAPFVDGECTSFQRYDGILIS